MNASALQSAKLITNHFIRTLTGKIKKGIIVVGAGGHAKVCIELLREMGYRVDYCIGTELDADVCLDVSVLRGDHHLDRLHEQGYTHVFIAIGNGKLRQRLAILAKDKGFTLVNAISSSAKISPSARLGEGIAIMSGVVINADARIGDYAIINTGASVDHDCTIEESTHIAPQCALAGNVRVGKHSFLGIGANVIPDISIGDNVTIGAGGVVIANIPDGVVAVGVPVRIIKASN